jgi:cytochrome bd-type quinol oxidase subunit 2
MDSTGYKIFLLIHVVAVVVAFGGNFVQPMLARAGNVADETFAKAALYIQLPALVVVFVAGMGLIGLSDEAWTFSQTWVSLAFLVSIVAIVLQFLVSRAFKGGNAKQVPMLTGGLHLMLVVAIYLMIWKPGL